MSDQPGPTPRTDALILPFYKAPWRVGLKGLVHMLFGFREIERESDARAERIAELEDKLNELSDSRSELKIEVETWFDLHNLAKAESAKLREALELAKPLASSWVNFSGMYRDDLEKIIQALAGKEEG